MKRLPMLLSLLALIALSISITYWVLQWSQPAQREQAATPSAALPPPAIDAAATLFGGQASTAVASNYQLTGVVAAGRESVAIIVADGTPKALKLGKEVVSGSGVTVKEVHPRYVMLSDGGVLKRIELALDTKPANGALTPPLPNQPQGQQPQFQPQPQPQPPPPQPSPQPQPSLQSPPSVVPPPPASVQMAPPMRGQSPNIGPAQLQ